jgi:hypothetical protein
MCSKSPGVYETICGEMRVALVSEARTWRRSSLLWAAEGEARVLIGAGRGA